MPLVTMPDGSVVEMPDNPTPELKAAVQGKLDRMAAENAHSGPPQGMLTWEGTKHKAKLFGSDIVKGVAGLPALALDLNAFDPTTGELPKEFGGASKALQGSMTQPQNDAERWQSLLTQSAAGGVAGPGGIVAPVRSAVTGVAGGVGSQLSANAFGEGLVPRLLGGLVGGVGAGYGTKRLTDAVRPNTATLAREAMQGVPPELVAKAKAFMESSAAQGVTVDLAQALEAVGAPASNITTIRNVLANNKSGDKVQETLRNQPTELSIRATTAVGRMPGNVYGEQQAANNLAETATQRIADVKQARTDQWSETLNDAIAALRASKLPAVTSAVADLRRLGAARQQLEAQIPQLQAALRAAQGQDAAAVAAANAKIAAVREQIKNLQSFTLPRGATQTNRGSLMQLPQRGESIGYDSLSREAQANNLERNLPPKVAAAPSLPTLTAEQQLAEHLKKVDAAKTAEVVGMDSLNAARADLKTATHVPAESVANEVTRLQRLAEQTPRTPKAALLTDLANRLNGLTRADQINEVLKAAVAKTKMINLDTPGVDAGTAKFLQAQVDNVRKNFETTFTPYQQANAGFRQFTQDVVNPLKQGPVGQLATPRGYKPDMQASVAKMNGLFSAGVDPQAKISPIRQAATELAKVDKEAFADAAKTYYSGKVASAFDPTIAGAPATNADAAQRLWNSLFVNEKQYQGMKDTVAAVAKTHGLSERDAVRGLENFAQITKALKSRPASVGGVSREDVFRMSGKNYGADAFRVFGFLPFERVARKLEDFTMSNVFSDFDNILTTPEGADMLIKLSKVPAISNKAITLLSTAGGVTPATAAGANSPGIMAQ